LKFIIKMQNISIFVPHVFSNYDADMVTSVFNRTNIGKIKQVDVVTKMTPAGKIYNTAYVHFEYWYDTIVARNFQSLVLDPKKEARINYNGEWYWVVLENKSKKVISGDRKPKIVLDAPSITTHTSYEVEEQPNVLQQTNVLKNMSDQEVQTETEDVQTEEFITMEDIEQMEELDAYIEEEEQHLITIDSRYVDTLEQENLALRYELEMFKQSYYFADKAYQEERIKSTALAEAISLIHKQ